MTTTEIYQSRRAWILVATGLAISNAAFFGAFYGGLHRLPGITAISMSAWVVLNVLQIMNVRDDRKQALYQAHARTGVRQMQMQGRVDGPSVEEHNCEFVEGRCWLCGAREGES